MCFVDLPLAAARLCGVQAILRGNPGAGCTHAVRSPINEKGLPLENADLPLGEGVNGMAGCCHVSFGVAEGGPALMLGPHESLPTVHPTSSPAAGERPGTKIDPIQKPRPSDGVSGRAISMASLAVPPDDATTAALSVRPASLVEKRILLGQG